MLVPPQVLAPRSSLSPPADETNGVVSSQEGSWVAPAVTAVALRVEVVAVAPAAAAPAAHRVPEVLEARLLMLTSPQVLPR